MTLAHLTASAGLAWALAGAPAAAQSPLSAALDLYAAASYDDALAALDGARHAQPSVDDLVTIERHRLLCLVALGRTAAAQEVVVGLLDARPDFVLTAGDASPRVRAVFDAARARILPALVRRRYGDARRAYDAGQFDAAADGFFHVVGLLADPAVAALDSSMSDLLTLADGFLQLSGAARERARAASDLETVRAAMRVVRASNAPPSPVLPAMLSSGSAIAAWTLRPVALPQPPPAAVDDEADTPGVPAPVESPRFAPMGIFTYDWRDADVAPPVAVAQPVTGWWGSMREPAAGTQLGAIEVVVDESGGVADARIYLSVNRVYDAVLLESVKQWRYRPAMKDGRAVKYRRVTGVVSGR